MQARGGEGEDHVARDDPVRTDDLVVLDDTGRRAGDVVLVRLEETGVLCGLAADQCDTGELAPLRDATDDGRDALGDHLARGDVVRHEERLGAADDDVVDDHADEVLADGVVAVHGLGDGDLGADAVGGSREDRAAHALEGGGVEHAGEAAQAAEDLGAGGAADRLLHEVDGLVAGLDVDPGVGIGDRLLGGGHGRRTASSVGVKSSSSRDLPRRSSLGSSIGYVPEKQAVHSCVSGWSVAAIIPSSLM